MKSSLIILLGFVLFYCSNQPDANTYDSIQEDIKTLNVLLDEAEQLIRTEFSADKYMSFFEENAVIYPPESSPIQGKKNISEFYAAFGTFNSPSFSFSDRSFKVGDSIAVAKYEGYGAIINVDSGDTLTVSNHKYIDVLMKQSDGNWKIVWHMWNKNKPIE